MGEESLEELAAKGRATRLAEDKQRAEARAKIAAEQSDTDRARAAWRLSPYAGNPIRWVFSIPGWMVWGVSLMMAFPYLRYFANGGHPVHGSSRGGRGWVLDPEKDGYALFYVFLATTTLLLAGIVWRVIVARSGARAFRAESAWAESQPFGVLGYPTAVGQNERIYKIELFFVGTRPRREQLGDALRGLDDCVREDSWSDRHCRYIAGYPADQPVKSAQRFARTLRAIVALLVTLQDEHPIDRVEIRG
jgi:hypothetical protein